jgi:hypothetical protein
MMNEVFRRQKPLFVAGSLFFALFLVLAVVSLFDSTQISGVDRWVKPIKFSISPAIYLWTLGFYLFFIRGRERAKKIIGGGVIFLMAAETALIVMQTCRGVASHFNVSSGFDGMVFSAMGILILINTFLMIYLLVLAFRAEIDLPASIAWGMRFGLIMFLLSGVVGGVMSALLRHSVRVEDGGAGLPLLNWSTSGGDLRVAHFIGMHALQAVPLFAYTLEKYRFGSAALGTRIFAALYFALFAFVFAQALSGRPFLG